MRRFNNISILMRDLIIIAFIWKLGWFSKLYAEIFPVIDRLMDAAANSGWYAWVKSHPQLVGLYVLLLMLLVVATGLVGLILYMRDRHHTQNAQSQVNNEPPVENVQRIIVEHHVRGVILHYHFTGTDAAPSDIEQQPLEIVQR